MTDGKKRKRAANLSESDALQWNKVEVPDLAVDAEGFVDLEEIEDVRVDWEESSGLKRLRFLKAKREKHRRTQKHNVTPGKASETQSARQSVETNEFILLPTEKVSLPEWEKLGLSESTLRALDGLQFSLPTPIQRLCIPILMEGRDVIGKASTGSGKTLTFGIPIIEHIQSNAGNETLSALIVAPTRELARQITDHLIAVSKFSSASVISITGGLSLQKQQRLLEQRPDIVVATPGRLWELMQQSVSFSNQISMVKFVVFDEADRLLQEGHFVELEEIVNALNTGKEHGRQTLVFSATFKRELQRKLGKRASFQDNGLGQSDAVEYLIKRLKFREKVPQFVDANPKDLLASNVSEGIVECDTKEKDLILYYFVLRYTGRTIVFVNSIDAVKRIMALLAELQVKIMGLHSNMIQKARLRSIEKFRSLPDAIMIASDVAARGLDIPSVRHVIHYHLPRAADMYIHRSGRTARGAEEGVSILLCSANETSNLRKMLIKLDKDVKDMVTFPVDRDILERLRKRVILARKITEFTTSKRKAGQENVWLQAAADDLGFNLDELETDHRKQKIDSVQIQNVEPLRHELKSLLADEIHSRFSRRYLTGGLQNMAAKLLDDQDKAHSASGTASDALRDTNARTRRA